MGSNSWWVKVRTWVVEAWVRALVWLIPTPKAHKTMVLYIPKPVHGVCPYDCPCFARLRGDEVCVAGYAVPLAGGRITSDAEAGGCPWR